MLEYNRRYCGISFLLVARESYKRMKKIVAIKWIDSSAHSTGWTDEKDLELIPILTVGFLISETDESYSISHSIGFKGLHFDVFMIPKGCVLEIKDLEGPNASKKQTKGKSPRVSGSVASGKIRLKG